MRAPDMRCGWLLVRSAALRLRPGANGTFIVGSSCSVAPDDPTDPDRVNAAIRCSASIVGGLRPAARSFASRDPVGDLRAPHVLEVGDPPRLDASLDGVALDPRVLDLEEGPATHAELLAGIVGRRDRDLHVRPGAARGPGPSCGAPARRRPGCGVVRGGGRFPGPASEDDRTSTVPREPPPRTRSWNTKTSLACTDHLRDGSHTPFTPPPLIHRVIVGPPRRFRRPASDRPRHKGGQGLGSPEG